MLDDTTAKAVQDILEQACATEHVGAAALAISDGKKAQSVAAGLANAPENITADEDTLFYIGSITKALTAELLWNLALKGELDVDAPIADALPEIRHIEGLLDPGITVARLLTHTSGIDGDIMLDTGASKDVLRRFMGAIQEISTTFAPGAYFSYANVAYNILARLVETRGGAPFEDLLRQHLRDTYGLTHFGISPEEKMRHRLALDFFRHEDKWIPSGFGPHSNIGSGTVLTMSMPALATWGAQLGASGESFERMRGLGAEMPFSHRYEGWGHGLTLLDDMGQTVCGHDGGTSGTSTFLRILPKSGKAWSLSATGGGAGTLFRQLDAMIRETLGLSPLNKQVTPDSGPRDLSLYEGTYARYKMRFTLKADADGLKLEVGDDYATPALNGVMLTPLNSQIFDVHIPALGTNTWMSFHEFDEAGRPHLFHALERMSRRKEG